MARRGTAPGTGYVGLLLATLILGAACGTTDSQRMEEPPWEGRLLAPSEAPAMNELLIDRLRPVVHRNR